MVGLQLASSAASGALGFMGQQAEYKQQQQANKINLANAKKSTFERYDAINTRVQQEKAAATERLQEAQIAGLQARGSSRVAAQESGVGGLSVTNVMRDMYRRSASYERNTQVNFDYTRDALISENRQSRAQGQNQINSAPRGTKPSPFAAVLNIFGQSLSTLASA